MSTGQFELGVAGAGKMGSALIRGLIAQGCLTAERIIAADVHEPTRTRLAESCPGVTVVESVEQAAAAAGNLLIAVKPQDFEKALQPAVAVRSTQQLVISIMAGVPIRRLEALLGEDTPIIRAMPNVACEVSQGAFGYCGNGHVNADRLAMVGRWFNAIGAAEQVKEELLDAVTGLSGSGPAFVALFIEALADGGVAAGLPRPVALRLAAQTAMGAAKWVLEIGGPAALKDAVCSPAGTTIAGVRELESAAFRSAAVEAVVAAAERAKELGA